jgi:hypothetical protein
VKPIWLLMMKWIEPPVRCPSRPDRPRIRRHTPWPANAASPCSSSGSTLTRSRVSGGTMSPSRPIWSCLARALPSTTGSTISRCDGLAVSDRCTLLPSNSRSDEAPRWYFTSPEPSTTSSGVEGAALELVEQRAMRLAHHLGQHVEAAAMGHAEHDVLHAQIAAALDDLLERRDQRLAAVEAEALGAGVLDVENFSKPSASISFLRIAFLPFAVKVMPLSGPSMRSWIQLFSRDRRCA